MTGEIVPSTGRCCGCGNAKLSIMQCMRVEYAYIRDHHTAVFRFPLCFYRPVWISTLMEVAEIPHPVHDTQRRVVGTNKNGTHPIRVARDMWLRETIIINPSIQNNETISRNILQPIQQIVSTAWHLAPSQQLIRLIVVIITMMKNQFRVVYSLAVFFFFFIFNLHRLSDATCATVPSTACHNNHHYDYCT